MTSPYGPPGGNDPQQQWGQQPYGGGPTPGTPSGGFPAPGGYPQQPGQPQQPPQQPQQPPQQQPPGQPQYGQPEQPYGGYGQPQQQQPPQYGQPQYGQQPPQYGQPPGEYPNPYQHPYQQQPPQKKGGGTWIWITMVVVVLAAATFLVLGLVTPGFLNKTVLDQTALQGDAGVKKILVDEYKVPDVESVTCPADQEVKPGNKFQCTVKIGGDDPKEMTVDITITDDEGQYQVALPEEAK